MSDIAYAVTSHEAAPAALKVHRAMLDLVRRYRPESVIEIGSGTGLLGAQIVAEGIEYRGIEPEAEQYRVCKQKFPNLNVLQASCYDDPDQLRLGRAEVVISNDVIEHLYAPRKLVGFARAHLEPGGKVITCTPDFGSYLKNIAYSLANRWDRVHSPLWDGGHIKFFSRRSLRAIFEEGGFGEFAWYNVRDLHGLFTMSIVCVCSLMQDPRQRGSGRRDIGSTNGPAGSA